MVVDGGALSAELRRRRLGRRGLARRVATSTRTTHIPAADLRMVSSDLLLLAAVAITPMVVAEK